MLTNYLLDTDVLIWILRGNQTVVAKVKKLCRNQPQVISVISVAEIYKNIFPSEVMIVERLFSINRLTTLSYETAKLGGLYWRDYQKSFPGISLMDCLLAASVTLEKIKLITCNTKHYPMIPKSKLINPLS